MKHEKGVNELRAFFFCGKEGKTMATTTWIPLHVGKDGSILKALQRTITYVENPNKTENGTLVRLLSCSFRASSCLSICSMLARTVSISVICSWT